MIIMLSAYGLGNILPCFGHNRIDLYIVMQSSAVRSTTKQLKFSHWITDIGMFYYNNDHWFSILPFCFSISIRIHIDRIVLCVFFVFGLGFWWAFVIIRGRINSYNINCSKCFGTNEIGMPRLILELTECGLHRLTFTHRDRMCSIIATVKCERSQMAFSPSHIGYMKLKLQKWEEKMRRAERKNNITESRSLI